MSSFCEEKREKSRLLIEKTKWFTKKKRKKKLADKMFVSWNKIQDGKNFYHIHVYILFHLVMCVFILKFISCHKKVSSLRIIILEYNNNSIQKSPSFPELLHSNIGEHCKMETVMEWNHCLKYSYHEKHPRNDSL